MAAPNSSPPRIDTQSPITPSNEWADMTTSALGTKNVLHSADSTNAWAGSSAASTPGPDFPGSYPRNEYPTSTAPENGSLLDSARQYLPAQEDVQHAITSAGQTAKYYLPTGVANYMSGTTEKQPAVSLPSTEVGGAKPFEATGGVGALPGRISEAGVATLPAERVVDEKAAQAASSKPNPEQDASAAKANPEQQPLPPQRLTPRLGLALAREKGLNKSVDEDEEELPTKVVPAEPVKPVESDLAPKAAIPSSPSKPAPEVPAPVSQSAHAAEPVPTRPTEPAPPAAKENAKAAHQEADKDVDYHPAALHPDAAHPEGTPTQESLGTKDSAATGSTAPTSATAPLGATATKDSQATKDSHISHHSRSSTDSGKSAKKPGFMSKVRGEAKVLAGKIGHNEGKVEEGRRMMHGEL